MTKFMVLVSTIILLSAGMAQATPYAPRPGDKGMPLVTDVKPVQTAVHSDCNTSELSQRSKARNTLVAGGNTARAAATIDKTCRASIAASEVQGSYGKR